MVNSGSGPAVAIEVEWVAKEVKVGRDSFTVDSTKANEPLYGSELNTMPTWRELLAPSGSAKLSRLPSFVVMDIEHKSSEVSGILLIRCTDITGRHYETIQEFWLATAYGEPDPSIHVTFGDLVKIPSVKVATPGKASPIAIVSRTWRGWLRRNQPSSP